MNSKQNKKLCNMLSILRTNFSKQGNNTGMTLMELLFAGLAGGIVLTTAGTSLYQVMVQNKNVANQIDTRTNVSRAMDFIKYESKQALQFEYTDSTTLTNVAPTFTLPTGASVPLAMSLPNLSEAIIYYIAPPPSNSLWEGPLVLYRRGPKLNGSGDFLDPQNANNWSTEPLVDMIDDTALTPSCPSGWSPNPTSSATGFYTCISSDQKASQIYLNGEIKQAMTNNDNQIHEDERTLVSLIHKPSSIAPAPAPITSNPVAAAPNCEVENGILSCDQPARLSIEIIGDDYACGKQIPILTQFIVDPDGDGGVSADYVRDNNGNTKNFRANDANYENSLELEVNPDTEVVVKSVRSSGSCGASSRSSNRSSDQPFIKSLRDGDTVPSTNGWNGQDSVESYLRNYTNANGNISLADNQIIYLFEMFTSTNGSTYDLQDNVVLVTIAHPTN